MDVATPSLPLLDDLWNQLIEEPVTAMTDSSPFSSPSTSQPDSPATSPYEVPMQKTLDTVSLEAQLFAHEDFIPALPANFAQNDFMDVLADLSPEVLQQHASDLLAEISTNNDLLSDINIATSSPISVVPEAKSDLSASGSSSDSDTKEKKKNSKKRRNCEPIPSTPGPLQEDELVKLNRAQLEATTKQLHATGAMTQDEIKELKKRRRPLKNREYAQLSRHRKRAYVDELEGKLKDQSDYTRDLAAKNTSLMLENQQLRQKTSRLQKMLQQSALVAAMLKNFTVTSKNPASSAPAASALGVCLMVVFLSFGVFFNQDAVSPPLPTNLMADGPARRPPVDPSITKFYTGRNLMENGRRFGLDFGSREDGDGLKNSLIEYGFCNITTTQPLPTSQLVGKQETVNATQEWLPPTTFVFMAAETQT